MEKRLISQLILFHAHKQAFRSEGLHQIASHFPPNHINWSKQSLPESLSFLIMVATATLKRVVKNLYD